MNKEKIKIITVYEKQGAPGILNGERGRILNTIITIMNYYFEGYHKKGYQ